MFLARLLTDPERGSVAALVHRVSCFRNKVEVAHDMRAGSVQDKSLLKRSGCPISGHRLRMQRRDVNLGDAA